MFFEVTRFVLYPPSATIISIIIFLSILSTICCIVYESCSDVFMLKIVFLSFTSLSLVLKYVVPTIILSIIKTDILVTFFFLYSGFIVILSLPYLLLIEVASIMPVLFKLIFEILSLILFLYALTKTPDFDHLP